jgi:dihydropteroate synthase
MLRVHDVAPMREALKVAEAILESGGGLPAGLE